VGCIREDCVVAGGVDCFLALWVDPWFLDCDDVMLFWVELLQEGDLNFVAAMVDVVLYDCEIAGVAIHQRWFGCLPLCRFRIPGLLVMAGAGPGCFLVLERP
jgi:hypothetical protein